MGVMQCRRCVLYCHALRESLSDRFLRRASFEKRDVTKIDWTRRKARRHGSVPMSLRSMTTRTAIRHIKSTTLADGGSRATHREPSQ